MKKICILFVILFSHSLFSQVAYFYQTVGPMISGKGYNTVETGTSSDGVTVRTNYVKAIDFYIGTSPDSAYGDPVISYLPNGKWAMTAWTGSTNYHGGSKMLYYESNCPVVADNSVIALGAKSTAGCQFINTLQIGKTSQVFGVGSKTYVLHSNQLGVNIACLSDATNSAMSLTGICVKSTPYSTLAQLNYGESMPVVTSTSLNLSDAAIAKRTDGTWVVFLKGISNTSTCVPGSLCELAARGIYRTTTSDFITWTPLELMVTKASVPEATNTSDGKVWLYWQDFTNACNANNLALAARAPISSAYEQLTTFSLSSPVQVTFNDESFQTNTILHYATNGNPVFLPSQSAIDAYKNCITGNGGTWYNIIGIPKNQLANNFVKVYPNPSSGQFSIEWTNDLQNKSIAIINSLGQVVFTDSTQESKISFDLNWLPGGMYFVKTTTQNGYSIHKINIE